LWLYFLNQKISNTLLFYNLSCLFIFDKKTSLLFNKEKAKEYKFIFINNEIIKNKNPIFNVSYEINKITKNIPNKVRFKIKDLKIRYAYIEAKNSLFNIIMNKLKKYN